MRRHHHLSSSAAEHTVHFVDQAGVRYARGGNRHSAGVLRKERGGNRNPCRPEDRAAVRRNSTRYHRHRQETRGATLSRCRRPDARTGGRGNPSAGAQLRGCGCSSRIRTRQDAGESSGIQVIAGSSPPSEIPRRGAGQADHTPDVAGEAAVLPENHRSSPPSVMPMTRLEEMGIPPAVPWPKCCSRNAHCPAPPDGGGRRNWSVGDLPGAGRRPVTATRTAQGRRRCGRCAWRFGPRPL